MRQLKAFMKAKKGVCSKKCECLTINMWRCADLQNGEEFCGCGENKSSLPNYVKVEGNATSGGWIQFFNEDEEQGNVVTIEIDTDTETPGIRVAVGEFLIIEDEDARALWLGMRESLDGEAVVTLFGMDEGKTGVGHFTPEAMTQFNAFVNNPTEEQVLILKDWLEYKASDEQHSPIVIFDPEKSVGDKVYAELIDAASQLSKIRYFTNGESGEDYILNDSSQSGMELYGIFDSARGQTLKETVGGDYLLLFTIGKGGVMPTTGAVGTIDADAMVLIRKVFEDPSEENKQELTSFLQAHMEAQQQGDVNAMLVTYPIKTSVTLLPRSSTVLVSGQIVIDAAVTPNNESITAVSSDPSILKIDSVEKNTGVPINAYIITCTGIAAGTATITATCVNDPSVSATTPTITVTE